MFVNLEAELRRNSITRAALALVMHQNISTVSQKLSNKHRLKLNEAFRIRDSFFPGMNVDYLFHWVDDTPAQPGTAAEEEGVRG